MSAVEEARGLLALMESHVRDLGGMSDARVFDDAVFGFHAQQAVEVAPKAWLSVSGTAFPRTHDLSALLHLLRQRGVETAPFEDLVELNAFGVHYRCDLMDAGEPPLDRVRILTRVSSLRDRIAGLIPRDSG